MRFLLALALAAVPATALAQNFPQLPEATSAQCYLPGPPQGAGQTRAYLDMGLTQAFRIDASKRDDAVMAAVTGVWYGEEPSPDGLYKAFVYYSFEPNGLFQYQSKSCGAYQCSDSYGTGQWVGLREAGGQIRVIFNYSDLNIESACGGVTGMLDGNLFRHNTGAVWQLTQKYESNALPVDPGMGPGRLELDNLAPPAQ